MTNPTNQVFSTKLRRSKTNVNKPSALPAGVTPNPFGSSVQFSEVDYATQINHEPPPGLVFFPTATAVVSSGYTIELWFNAESSGSLINGLMRPNTQTMPTPAPLVYIDADGFLRAGLFDSTQLTLMSPAQNLIASQLADGSINVGPLNALKSPLPVVDGEWHHCAYVAQPGTGANHSLYLDGRLADSGTANGNFSLAFYASDGTGWGYSGMTFGGRIAPQPIWPPQPNFLPYAAGFCGLLNEVRIWGEPRTVTQIQQLIDQPLGSNPPEEILGYIGGANQWQGTNLGGNFVSLEPSAPPVDPFTDVTNRIPGYQNYGICTAIPFSTVGLQVAFQPSVPYSTKISLRQGDQLQVDFPSTDSGGSGLSGTFSMILTGGASGQIENTTQIAPNSVLTIGVAQTDCYRLDFTYSETATIDNLQFMLIPGAKNTLMQLLLDVVPLQAAYTDPNYPTTPTLIPNPQGPGNITSYPYWPLFTDQNVFPIDPTKYSSTDLLRTYLSFNDAAKSLNSNFADFLNLTLNHATLYEPSDLKTLLGQAYFQVTGSPAPPVPPTEFNTSVDQIYAFLFNVNAMRESLSEFLNAYKIWGLAIVGDLALAGIPAGIANQIYNAQQQISVTLRGPSAGDIVANIMIGSAIAGLGAIFPMLLPAAAVAEGAEATVASGSIGSTLAASAGANALVELIGGFFNSSSAQANLHPVSYTTLQNLAQNITAAAGAVYETLIGNLLNPTYMQTLYSNYGLLQALSYVNAQPLYDANQNEIQPGANNSLNIGTNLASWKALIPAVFTWAPQLLTNQYLDNNSAVFKPHGSFMSLPYKTIPPSLGVQAVLQNDLWGAFYTMLNQAQTWQTSQTAQAGQFFTICPIFYYGSSGLKGDFEYAFDWVIAWSLVDTNGHPINSTLAATLFGTGTSNVQLRLADQNVPFTAAGYGWYCEIENGAVVTPFDAFMNWGEGMPSYSPQILVAQWPVNGNLYNAFVGEGLQVVFAATVASDTPPPALVTIEPESVTFKISIGTTGQTPVVIKNNQENSLQNITLGGTWPPCFTLQNAPTQIPSGGYATATLSFSPTASDTSLQSGTATFTAQGQYGPVTLTLSFSGIGF